MGIKLFVNWGVEMNELMIADNNEIFKLVEKRILNGWMLVIGDLEFFRDIEYSIYPPETPKNKNFELITMSGKVTMISFALIKKNDELHDALGGLDNFDNVIFVENAGRGFVGNKCLLTSYKGPKNGFREFVRDKLFYVFNNIDDLINKGIFEKTVGELWDDLDKQKSPKKTPRRKRKPLTKSIKHEVLKRDNYKCVECGAIKEDTTLHVDHIVPVAQGGSDELDNLQTLCKSCNLSKSNRAWKGGE